MHEYTIYPNNDPRLTPSRRVVTGRPRKYHNTRLTPSFSIPPEKHPLTRVHELSGLRRAAFLTGERYREFLARHLAERAVAISIPMKGLRIGEQISLAGKATEVRTVGR